MTLPVAIVVLVIADIIAAFLLPMIEKRYGTQPPVILYILTLPGLLALLVVMIVIIIIVGIFQGIAMGIRGLIHLVTRKAKKKGDKNDDKSGHRRPPSEKDDEGHG